MLTIKVHFSIFDLLEEISELNFVKLTHLSLISLCVDSYYAKTHVLKYYYIIQINNLSRTMDGIGLPYSSHDSFLGMRCWMSPFISNNYISIVYSGSIDYAKHNFYHSPLALSMRHNISPIPIILITNTNVTVSAVSRTPKLRKANSLT